MESDQNLGFEQVSDTSGTKRMSEGSNGYSDIVHKRTRVSEILNDDHEEQRVFKLELKLIDPTVTEENRVNDVGACNQSAHGFDSDGIINDVMYILSDDNDNDNGNGNDGVDNEDGGNGDDDDDNDDEGVDDDSDSDDGNADDYNDGVDDDGNDDDDGGNNDCVVADVEDTVDVVVSTARALMAISQTRFIKPQDIIIPEDQERESQISIEEVVCREFGYVDDILHEYICGTIYYKKTEFSNELKDIIARNKKQRAEKLIVSGPHHVVFPPRVPSLLDLSLNALAKNSDAISSLDHIPEFLKRRLTDLLCDNHKMNIHVLELLFKGHPTEIRIKNCYWLTEEQLVGMIQKSNLQNLKVLQLDYCLKCWFEEIIPAFLARSSNNLACLGILSVKGAAIFSNTLHPLLESAPLLYSINLSECRFLTCASIKMISYLLKTRLKELYIDYCQTIDVMLCVSSIVKLECLEVLSLARNQSVRDEFVTLITAACGKTLKELNLSGCWRLTDRCLQAIGNFCPTLCSLNISYLPELTDFGMCYIADGCKSLQVLDIKYGDFSDEVVAALLETSGGSLKQLSLLRVGKVSFNTAFALAKYSKKLESLDMSYCTALTDEALGFIIDNSSSLKLLKFEGCNKITSSFIFKVTGSSTARDTFYL